MYYKSPPCPCPIRFVPAPDLFGESIYGPLRNPLRLFFLSIGVHINNIADTLLLTELEMLIPVCANAIQEIEGARTRANEHRSCVELPAITLGQQNSGNLKFGSLPICREEKIDLIWLRVLGKGFRDEICKCNCVVCNQGIKVDPPDPIVVSSFHNLLQHHELVPHNISRSIRFVVDDEIITVFSGIP